MTSRIACSAFAMSLTGLLVAGAPALAQEGSPGNPGQGSERCEAAQGNNPQYPPSQNETISDATPQPGQQVTAASGCREFAPGQRVAFGLMVGGTFRQLGTVVASEGGQAVATFGIPLDLAAGQYEVAFSGPGFTGGQNTVLIPIAVAAAAAPPAAPPAAGPGHGAAPAPDRVSVGGVQLPRTGSDEIVPLTALGLGLLTAGAGMVVVARRRRSSVTPTA